MEPKLLIITVHRQTNGRTGGPIISVTLSRELRQIDGNGFILDTISEMIQRGKMPTLIGIIFIFNREPTLELSSVIALRGHLARRDKYKLRYLGLTTQSQYPQIAVHLPLVKRLTSILSTMRVMQVMP